MKKCNFVDEILSGDVSLRDITEGSDLPSAIRDLKPALQNAKGLASALGGAKGLTKGLGKSILAVTRELKKSQTQKREVKISVERAVKDIRSAGEELVRLLDRMGV